MADKQPIKKGRGRPPKVKKINTSIESHIEPHINHSNHIDNINNYKIDNPDDIQSIIQQIDDSELAIVIDDSFASNIAMQINSSILFSYNDLIYGKIYPTAISGAFAWVTDFLTVSGIGETITT